MSSNGCSGSSSSQQQTSTNVQQATPFNIGIFGVLFVFCIIIALTSSLYYNWPAIERILVDDKVFQNLCTKDEIYNAIDGMFVCDEQRKQIGNLALIIFYTEFIAFAIGGLLTDIAGVYVVLLLGFVFGFLAFITLYYFYMDNFMIKVSFALWGMFGGFVFITSIQFPKMFPEATSLADGMIIMFDNISGLMPIIIYKLMKKFNLKYYEAFGTYILWGIIPSFLLVITFIPYKIMPKNQSSNNDVFKCMDTKLKDHKLWTNYIVFSIPVTCSIFYKKTFSTYFLKNQTLVKIFPIIMLFVFVPTIFIAALNQFMGVHITSCILYIFYIISFVCFLYPTKQYGLLSIILFVISTSAAEQQTMTYISENHPYNESTLLGISYAVDFIVGSILQRIFDRIYDRSPMSILFLIIPLFNICILYSLYCATGQSNGTGKSKTPSSKGLFLIFWFIPFCILCIRLAFNSFIRDSSEVFSDVPYKYQKIRSVSTMFYSFTFYYICNIYYVLVSMFKIKVKFPDYESRNSYLLYLIVCFFIIPHLLIICYSLINTKSYANITPILFSLLIFKFIMFYFTNMEYKQALFSLFYVFLIIYGFVFFLFIYMLAYYNFQITYVDRCYKTSLLHWGSMISLFILFKLFYYILSRYEFGFLILWLFNICFFIYFSIIIYLYLPYEMNRNINSFSLNFPNPIIGEYKFYENFDLINYSLYCRLVNASLSICNLGIIVDLEFNKMMIIIFILLILLHRLKHIHIVHSWRFLNLLETHSDYLLTGLSTLLFVILLFARLFYKKFNTSLLVYILFCINLVVLSITLNISWLNIQSDLQKCCCTNNSDCCECNSFCCKDKTKSCCSCVNGKDKPCTCNPRCNINCTCNKENCKNCVCKCFKKVKTDENNYIFCFYESNFKKVDEYYLSFFSGNFMGWILFFVYCFLRTFKESNNS